MCKLRVRGAWAPKHLDPFGIYRRAMRREFVGIPSTAEEIEVLPVSDRMPTIVLSSTQPATGETPAFRTLAAQLQNEIATAYVARRHDFVPDSGHYIQRDQPQAVINAARELAGYDTGGVRLVSKRLVEAKPQ